MKNKLSLNKNELITKASSSLSKYRFMTIANKYTDRCDLLMISGKLVIADIR